MIYSALNRSSTDCLARMDATYRGVALTDTPDAHTLPQVTNYPAQQLSLKDQKKHSLELPGDEPAKPSSPRLLSPVSQRRSPDDSDIGWAAGLFDGEGCVHIARQVNKSRRTTYRLRLHIAQNKLMVLQEFEWCVGISGRIYSPKPTGEMNKTCHTLNYHGVNAFGVLERLVEKLRRKRPEAELAAEFRVKCDIHAMNGCNGCPEETWELRHWYYERMSELKWV